MDDGDHFIVAPPSSLQMAVGGSGHMDNGSNGDKASHGMSIGLESS